ANFLAAQPVSPLEKQHAVRSVLMAPVLDNVHAWQERFGIAEVWVMFNMTEVSSPLMRTGPVVDPATCGRPRPGAEVRVVDENDIEVPPGQVGELIVRTDLPWEMNLGYYGMPEATQAAWRNGWFHTGDAFRRDADGNHYYIDRIKDCIRRRGENVSSFEVESEINTYDGVQESAVVAVPSEHGEDEIKACIVARDGADIELPGLVAHLAERLPYFMVPRYYEVIPALPMTPTSKVKKADLRAAGRTSSTWDREAAGIKVSR
ncbi:MAG: AMP-binding protein, partial [Acidimicrobiia bacterium]